MRWWVLICLFVTAVCCAWRSGWFGAARSNDVASVWREAVTDEQISDDVQIFAGGIVEGAQPETSLRFELPGRVLCVHVQPGDTVHARQVLAELEPEEYQLRLAAAQAELKIALAEWDRLQSAGRTTVQPDSVADTPAPIVHPQRTRENTNGAPLQGEAAPTPAPLPAAAAVTEEDRTIAEARVALADVAVRQAQRLLDQTRLTAPADGTILTVLAKVGDLVAPDGEEEPLTMADRTQMRVRAFVEELDALRVAPGQRATVSAAGRPGHDYNGVVLSCSPYVRPKLHRHLKPGERIDVRVREVLIELDDAADLLVGLPVDVFIDPGQIEVARDLQTGRREYRAASAVDAGRE